MNSFLYRFDLMKFSVFLSARVRLRRAGRSGNPNKSEQALSDRAGILFVLFLSPAAFAEGGGPVREVFFQAFNFILFVALLVFLVRKPLRAFYKSRRENFLQFEETARAKEEKIRSEFTGWRDKLEKMRLKERTATESARREAEVFQNKKRRELQELKDRKHREIQFFLRLESEQMKKEILKTFKSKLAGGSEERLRTLGGDPAFHKNLHQSFVKTLQAGFENKESVRKKS